MWTNFVKVTRPALIDQIVKTAEIIKINHINSSVMFSRNFHSQCRLPSPSGLCQSTNKVLHQSSTVKEHTISIDATDHVQPIVKEQAIEGGIQLSDFQPLLVPEISDSFASYEDLFDIVAGSLTTIDVDEINDIDDFAQPILHDFMASIIGNENQQIEAFAVSEDISKLTMSILSLGPALPTSVPELKEEKIPVLDDSSKICDVKSAIPSQPSFMIPLKKRPICNEVRNTRTEKEVDQLDTQIMNIVSDGPKKKLKFDNAESAKQSDVSVFHHEYQSDTKQCAGNQLHVKFSTPENAKGPSGFQFDDIDDYWNEDIVKQLDDSVSLIQNMGFMHSPTMQFDCPPENSIPSKPLFFKHVFISSAVEKAVHEYIVSNIPPRYPARR